MKKEIGIIGLGKMGGNIARRLVEKKWRVVGYDLDASVVQKLEKEGVEGVASVDALIKALPTPRVVWLMVPAGKAGDELLFGKSGVVSHLERGDIVIDGGNSYFKDSVIRGKKLGKRGIRFVDVGFSGGPSGARNGGCLMVGGVRNDFAYIEPLIKAMAREGGYRFFNGVGAGHFVKMVHNGIEYGMMQSIAEGFELMKKSSYKLSLTDIAELYNQGSVIESRLVGWLADAFHARGEKLQGVSGSVGHTGEGAWTVKTAREMKVSVKVIAESLAFRKRSAAHPSFAGQVLSALREQFGGHSVAEKSPRKKSNRKSS